MHSTPPRLPPHYEKLRPPLEEPDLDDGNYGRPQTPPTPRVPPSLLATIGEATAAEEAAQAEQDAAAGRPGRTGDVLRLYRQWDALNRQALSKQMELDAVRRGGSVGGKVANALNKQTRLHGFQRWWGEAE